MTYATLSWIVKLVSGHQIARRNTISSALYSREERSKSRPLASGAVSLAGAVLLLAAHYAAITWLLNLAGPEGCVSLPALPQSGSG